MFSIRERFTRTSPPDTATTNEAANLLASCSLPDPNHLQRELVSVESQIAADDRAWERLDRTSNPHGFTEQQAIAARRSSLEAQCDSLRRKLAAAEKSRSAFVALAEIVTSMDQQIAQAAERLYADFLTAPKEERRARLESLDGLVRSRARLAAPLRVVSPATTFRRAPDPLRTLADDLRTRAAEIDRALGPGMPRQTRPWPTGAQELIDALNGGTA